MAVTASEIIQDAKPALKFIKNILTNERDNLISAPIGFLVAVNPIHYAHRPNEYGYCVYSWTCINNHLPIATAIETHRGISH